MRITRANVQNYAEQEGLEPIEIQGLPSGFAWKESDLQIGDKFIKGRIIKFKPLEEWDKGITYGE